MPGDVCRPNDVELGCWGRPVLTQIPPAKCAVAPCDSAVSSCGPEGATGVRIGHGHATPDRTVTQYMPLRERKGIGQ